MIINKMILHGHGRIFLVFFLCFCSFHLKAQTYADKAYYLIDSLNLDELVPRDKNLIDSALSLYYKAKSDTDRFNALMLITQDMVHEDWFKYNQYLYKKLQQSLAHSSLSRKEELFSKKMLANVLGDMGYYANYYQADIPKALTYFHKALDLSREIDDRSNVATMLNNIGSSAERIGDITGALEYYHESLKICEESGNKTGMPSALNNIGLVHLHQGNYTEAMDYFEKSLIIHKELGEQQNVAINLEHIGDCYRQLGNLEKAMEYRFRSLKVAEEIGDNTIIARELKSISEEYVLLDDLDKATEYGEKAYTIYEKTGNKKGIGSTSNLLGEISFKKGHLKKAKINATQSLKLAEELGFPDDIQNAASLNSNIYSKEGDYKKGLEMYKLYIVMRDSILNEKTQKAAIRQQTEYEFEKAQLLKEHNEQEQARIQKTKVTRRSNFQYAIMLILLLVLFIGIALMGRVKVTPKVVQAIIYLTILILFESSLVIADPYVESITKGEPAWKLLLNVCIAMLLFPLNTMLDKRLKNKLIKKAN